MGPQGSKQRDNYTTTNQATAHDMWGHLLEDPGGPTSQGGGRPTPRWRDPRSYYMQPTLGSSRRLGLGPLHSEGDPLWTPLGRLAPHRLKHASHVLDSPLPSINGGYKVSSSKGGEA